MYTILKKEQKGRIVMMDYNQIPLNVEYAFAESQMDKDKYTNMSDDEKREYIERNRSALSKKELEKLIDSLGEDDDTT